ncbi:MAG: ribonuclease domain-containing protein [Oscillospiraceae bacterium]|nr:ribonuclease domain-containing protein [Oscillospiraceae bacterium]
MKNKKTILSISGLVILIILGIFFGDNAFEFITDDSSFSEISMSSYEYSEESYESESSGESYETETSEESLQDFTSQPDTTYSVSEAEIISGTDNSIILESGSYTTPEDVAEYIHTFGTLPHNFITKDDAIALGWDKSKGNLWEVAEGMSIGGDRFGNYEGLLPDSEGRIWTECDVNYQGGFRGAERIIFSNDGLIFYTNDHYQTFEQLY